MEATRHEAPFEVGGQQMCHECSQLLMACKGEHVAVDLLEDVHLNTMTYRKGRNAYFPASAWKQNVFKGKVIQIAGHSGNDGRVQARKPPQWEQDRPPRNQPRPSDSNRSLGGTSNGGQG